VADLEHHLTQLDALTVGERLDRELGPRVGAVGDHRLGGRGQLEVAREKVCVEMGLDHPLDGQSGRPRVVEVAGDVALRIDHHRTPRGGVTDQVAEQRQARQLVLPKEHRDPPSDPRSLALRLVPDTPRGILASR
jgi:hypothetical protein